MPNRRYPRVTRVNEVLRQVVAEEIERLIDIDDRIGFLTVTGVRADPDYARATVLLASLGAESKEALMEHRVPIQRAIARQMRLKRTPLLSFSVDPAIVSGNRIEDLLRTIPRPPDDDDVGDDDAADGDEAGAAANDPGDGDGGDGDGGEGDGGSGGDDRSAGDA